MAETPSITLRGVRVNNLQGVDVEIPLHCLTVVVGVSGAGKSSLVFDTIYAEAQRRFLQGFSTRTRQFLERFEQPQAEMIGDLPAAIAVGRTRGAEAARATVGSVTEVDHYLQALLTREGVLHCPACDLPVRFHRVSDVVQAIEAFTDGTRFAITFATKPADDEDATEWGAALMQQGFFRLIIDDQPVRLGEQALPSINEATRVQVVVDRFEAGKIPGERLRESLELAFAKGQGSLALLRNDGVDRFHQVPVCDRCGARFALPRPEQFNRRHPLGACTICHGVGMHGKPAKPCSACRGSGWGDAALSVRWHGRTIADLARLTLAELFALLPQDNGASQARLEVLARLGLGHLVIDRAADTLSQGTLRRIDLANAFASDLVNALYLVDEPLTGLHPRHRLAVVQLLHDWRDRGNTVVVIEHDYDLIRSADHVVDLGPGAGEEGGRVLFQGPRSEWLKVADTPTADILREGEPPVPKRRKPGGKLRLSGLASFGLSPGEVDLPLGNLCLVTGPSGAGKSRLVEEALYPALCRHLRKKGEHLVAGAQLTVTGQIEDVFLIDQKPPSRSGRSNPASLLKIFDDIRELFAETTEARIRNLASGSFSFNQPGGRCETCAGQGTLTVDMQFLADVQMPCPECHGSRFTREVLEIKVRGLSIAEVLRLTAREAFRFFRAQAAIEKRLKVLLDVGLDYVRLGQPLDTLSDGESQRLKLASVLASNRKARCVFILLEPASGLHTADVAQLLNGIDRLLSAGHSVIAIDHHADLLRNADHIIDLDAGRMVAQGTPEEVAEHPDAPTAPWLRGLLADME
jgi:excinuclease ABC subunit A